MLRIRSYLIRPQLSSGVRPRYGPDTSRPVTAFIDPDELPFTVEEIFEAGQQFLPADVARQMADHLGECGPG